MTTTYIPKKRVTASGFQRAIDASQSPYLHGHYYSSSINRRRARGAEKAWKMWAKVLKGTRVEVAANLCVGKIAAHISYWHGTGFETIEPFRCLQGLMGTITSLRRPEDEIGWCGVEVYVRFDDGSRELIQLDHLKWAPVS